jgi:integrase
MGTRNYNLGTRDLADAGRRALDTAASRGDIGYATAATVADRWRVFAAAAKAAGIGRLEGVNRDLVLQWGARLAEMVRCGELSAAYGQVLLSSINTVMRQVRADWQSVRPVADCGIARRDTVRRTPPPDRAAFELAVDALRAQGHERVAAVVVLARELGLRRQEASLIDARAALRQAGAGRIRVMTGTKGGRPRYVQITDERQMEALRIAAAAQGRDRSMVPAGTTWAQWRDRELRHASTTVAQIAGCRGLHDLRAAFACQLYEAIAGTPAPAMTDGIMTATRDADLDARRQIAQELGHGDDRIEVTAAYLGGRGRCSK